MAGLVSSKEIWSNKAVTTIRFLALVYLLWIMVQLMSMQVLGSTAAGQYCWVVDWNRSSRLTNIACRILGAGIGNASQHLLDLPSDAWQEGIRDARSL